jgi:predicted nucleic acid-binding protein
LRQVVIDSSVLIDAVVYVKPKTLETIISRYEAFIPVNALEETLFKTIIGVVGDSIKKDNLFEIKKAWIKGIGREEVENRFDVVFELIQNDLIKVLDLNIQIFENSYLFSKIYGLLPNDALIAAACKHYGIRKIATFDPDFKRVDFLEVHELEE